jgi:hypothetical protein
MRLLRTTGLCALLLVSAGACEDLTTPTPTPPNHTIAAAESDDVEALIAGSYLTLFYGYTYRTDLVLSTASFQHSSMAANLGMLQLSKIPREPINNTTTDAFASTYGEIWYTSYAAIDAAVEGLNATNPASPGAVQIIDPQTYAWS